MGTRDLTADRLRELLHYDPETGIFTWKNRQRYGKKVNGQAGHCRSDGYVCIMVDSQMQQAHRLAWLYMTGEHPKQCIDHIDGNPGNNRFSNLRDLSRGVNAQNRRVSTLSTSGLIGAQKNGNRWLANIYVDKKRVYLGSFSTAEEAHAAYLAAKAIHHKVRPTWMETSNG